MKNKRSNLIWGLALILFGGVYLLVNLDVIPDFSPTVWSVVFAVVSLVSLVIYLTSGWQEWGWLFPIFVPGGLAAVIFLSESEVVGLWIGALFMASIALPFWLIFLINRENWWALIPGWIFSVLTAVILLSESAAGEILGALVMLGIALPFFIVFLVNRKQWWALIPAFILGGIGLILLFSRGQGEWIGAMILFAIGLPFLFVYLRRPDQWWAVIPAGIMATLAIIVLLSGLIESETWGPRVIAGVLFWGMALPFAFLWLRRDRYPTRWASYPALGLTVLGLLALIFGSDLEWIWAVALIVTGGWLLLKNARQPKLKS